ncbi:hypothetical protein BOX15_Mlig027975g3, partial [Macrostomum lignano]
EKTEVRDEVAPTDAQAAESRPSEERQEQLKPEAKELELRADQKIAAAPKLEEAAQPSEALGFESSKPTELVDREQPKIDNAEHRLSEDADTTSVPSKVTTDTATESKEKLSAGPQGSETTVVVESETRVLAVQLQEPSHPVPENTKTEGLTAKQEPAAESHLSEEQQEQLKPEDKKLELRADQESGAVPKPEEAAKQAEVKDEVAPTEAEAAESRPSEER